MRESEPNTPEEHQLWVARPELLKIIPQINLTPEGLFRENHLDTARRKRAIWNQNRVDGNLIAVHRCSDSRLNGFFPDELTVVIPSITTAAAKEPYEQLHNDRGIRGIALFGHFDGETLVPGKRPVDCGGLNAKAHNITGEEGIENYVGEIIKHDDVILEIWRSAEAVSKLTPKPVLAATMDHRTGLPHPFAAILDQGEIIHKARELFIADTFEGAYNPVEIYKNGIPIMRESLIPPEYADFLEGAARQTQGQHERYSDLYLAQKDQNPPVLYISTDIRPLSLKFPQTFGAPGVAFEIRVPRKKLDGTLNVPLDHFDTALNQAEYSLGHFSKQKYIVIETGNIGKSKELAVKLLKRKRAQEWLAEDPNRQIFIAGSTAGEIDDIRVYDTAA